MDLKYYVLDYALKLLLHYKKIYFLINYIYFQLRKLMWS